MLTVVNWYWGWDKKSLIHSLLNRCLSYTAVAVRHGYVIIFHIKMFVISCSWPYVENTFLWKAQIRGCTMCLMFAIWFFNFLFKHFQPSPPMSCWCKLHHGGRLLLLHVLSKWSQQLLYRSGHVESSKLLWRCEDEAWCGMQVNSIGIPMLKIRRSGDRLIFNMGIHIPGIDGLFEAETKWQPFCGWLIQIQSPKWF